MKRKILSYFKLLIASGLVFVTLQGCKKNLKAENQPIAIEKKSEINEIIAFIATTTEMPQEKIFFDKDKKEFYISGTNFKESLEDMQKRYNNANEYKFKNAK
jgi:hypothetical protein